MKPRRAGSGRNSDTPTPARKGDGGRRGTSGRPGRGKADSRGQGGRTAASKPSGDLRDASRGERLQKVLAAAGIASRRDCEALIEQGRVTVNGVVVRELPAWVDAATDRIQVDGVGISAPSRHLYVMFHKPRRTVSTLEDPGGRPTVADLVRHPTGARLYPVGRLDFETTGLLLLTNDGELANQLTHPRFGVSKTYRVTVRGGVDHDHLQAIQSAINQAQSREAGGGRAAEVRLELVESDAQKTVIDLTLSEGRNRHVSDVLARLGCPVKKVVRIRFGPLSLKGVGIGNWRELTPAELRELRQAARAERGTRGPVVHPATGAPGTSGAPSRRPARGAGKAPAARPLVEKITPEQLAAARKAMLRGPKGRGRIVEDE